MDRLIADTDRLGAFMIRAGSPVADVPGRTSLAQNLPNPFNAFTTISFTLAERGHVTLDVFNVQGRRVVRLIDGVRDAGSHTAVWHGASNQSGSLASGVYLYRLEAGSFLETKKMVLLK